MISLNIYNSNNTVISTINTYADIYLTTQTFGVVMVDITGLSFPILCSTTNLALIGVSPDVDDYYIVYPGWGFILYDNNSYGGISTRQYMNNTTTPILFTNVNIGGVTVNIFNSTGGTYGVNITASIKVFFRSVEVTVTGLS
jgi:hypothetical protein